MVSTWPACATSSAWRTPNWSLIGGNGPCRVRGDDGLARLRIGADRLRGRLGGRRGERRLRGAHDGEDLPGRGGRRLVPDPFLERQTGDAAGRADRHRHQTVLALRGGRQRRQPRGERACLSCAFLEPSLPLIDAALRLVKVPFAEPGAPSTPHAASFRSTP